VSRGKRIEEGGSRSDALYSFLEKSEVCGERQ